MPNCSTAVSSDFRLLFRMAGEDIESNKRRRTTFHSRLVSRVYSVAIPTNRINIMVGDWYEAYVIRFLSGNCPSSYTNSCNTRLFYYLEQIRHLLNRCFFVL